MDLNNITKQFYLDNIKLSDDDKNKLRELKKSNLKRLNKLPISFENIEQGSVAMSTTNKSFDKDYDIDIAIIFNEEDLKEEYDTPEKIKKLVHSSIMSESSLFKKEPEIRKNAVTIWYDNGNHVDFAVYKKIKVRDGEYKYEHAGEKWTERDPRAINNWFKNSVKQKSFDKNKDQMRRIVRYIKYFCKNKSIHNKIEPPGGLILSILVDESYKYNPDEITSLINCIKKIKNRLIKKEDIFNPTNDKLLVINGNDDKLIDLIKLLEEAIDEYDVQEMYQYEYEVDYNLRFLNYFFKNIMKSLETLYVESFDEFGHSNKIIKKLINKKRSVQFKIPQYIINRGRIKLIQWECHNYGEEAKKASQRKIDLNHFRNKKSIRLDGCYSGIHLISCYILFENGHDKFVIYEIEVR